MESYVTESCELESGRNFIFMIVGVDFGSFTVIHSPGLGG